MDALTSQVAALAGHNLLLAYLVVYLATIFLGNIGAFLALWAAFQGGLGAWGVPAVLVAAFAANVTGDILWYSMGRWLRTTRFGTWIKRRAPQHEKIETHVAERGPRWMLFAKFAYGSNFPIIFAIGWTRLPFGRFFRRSLLAIAIWLPVILGVSYGLYSSLSPLAALIEIKHFELLFLAALILFIILQFALVRFFEKIFGKDGENGSST
jgi:membrane protein DedA with SNARE-associated domain